MKGHSPCALGRGRASGWNMRKQSIHRRAEMVKMSLRVRLEPEGKGLECQVKVSQ